MAEGFPIYSDLIIKTDPSNLARVSAQLRQTLSVGSLNVEIIKPATLNDFESAMKRVNKEATGLIGSMNNLGDRVTKVFARFSAYLIASGGILTGISLMKDAIGQALRFSDELIRVKQVSGEADSSIRSLSKTVGDLAKGLGVSSSELIKSAVTLKQAGLSVREVEIGLKSLAQAELAPNFDNMAKTTEGLIAIYQQFGKNINQVNAQLGSLNAVAGEFAVEASDLITLVQKAGGAAKSSGAGFEELLGLFTSVRATTRESADSIATGLRTIFGRLQRPDTIKFLEQLGINLRVTSEEAKTAGKNVGDFVGPFEAILRISAGTTNMGSGSTLFANLIEEIGGLRQISRVVPLIREAGLAVEAYNVALAGQNSLYVSALQRQDSYLNKLTKIKEQFLEVGRDFVNSDGFEKLANTLGLLARVAISLTDALGPLMPYLGVLAVINTSAGLVRSVTTGLASSVGLRPLPSTRQRYASGGIVPGSGSGDKVPAYLEPGEAVIPKRNVQKYPQFIRELIGGSVEGFSNGLDIKGGTTTQRRRVSDLMSHIFDASPIRRDFFAAKELMVAHPVLANAIIGDKSNAAYFPKTQSIILPTTTLDRAPYSELMRVLGHETGHSLDAGIGAFLGNSGKKFPNMSLEPLLSKPDIAYYQRSMDGIPLGYWNKNFSAFLDYDKYKEIVHQDPRIAKFMSTKYQKGNRASEDDLTYLLSTSEVFARDIGEKFITPSTLGSKQKGLSDRLQKWGLDKSLLKQMFKGRFASGRHSGQGQYALLEPGEAVIPSNVTSQFPEFVSQLVSGNVKGFADGRTPKKQTIANLLMRKIGTFLTSEKEIPETFRQPTKLDKFADSINNWLETKIGDPIRQRAEAIKNRFTNSIPSSDATIATIPTSVPSKNKISLPIISPPLVDTIDWSKVDTSQPKSEMLPIPPKKTYRIPKYPTSTIEPINTPNNTTSVGNVLTPSGYGFRPGSSVSPAEMESEKDAKDRLKKTGNTQQGINPQYAVNEYELDRQYRKNKEQLDKLLKIKKEADLLKATGGSSENWRVREAIESPVLFNEKIKNLQIAQQTIASNNIGPVGLHKGPRKTSLPVVNADMKSGEVLEMLASAAGKQNAARNPNLTIAGMTTDSTYQKIKSGRMSAQEWVDSGGLGKGITMDMYGKGAQRVIYNNAAELSTMSPQEQASFIREQREQRVRNYFNGKTVREQEAERIVREAGLDPNNLPGSGGSGSGRGRIGTAGGGGTGGTGGSGKGGGFDEEFAAKKFRGSRLISGLSTGAGLVAPLAFGAAAAYSKKSEDQALYSSIALGASVGSAGFAFNPAVGAITTGIGAITGWFLGAKAAADELKKTAVDNAIDKSTTRLGQVLNDFTQGSGSLSSLADSLEQVRKDTFQKAKLNLKPNESLITKANEEFQKTAGVNLASYQRQINEALKKQAENGLKFNIREGDIGRVSKDIINLRQRSGEKFGIAEYEKEQEKAFKAFRADKQRRDAEASFTMELDKSVYAAKSFAEAVQAASDSASELDNNFNVILNGGYNAPSFRVGNFGNLNKDTISSLSNIQGLRGLTSEVTEADKIAKYLPEVLSRIIKPGEANEGSLAEGFEDTYANIAKQTGESFDKRVIGMMANKLASLKTDELFKDFQKAPDQFAADFLKSFEPARAALESIGRNLAERDRAYQQGLNQLRQVNQQINELSDRIASSKLAELDIGTEISNRQNLVNSTGLISAQRVFNRRQADLGAGGLDAAGIGTLLSAERENVRILTEKAREEAKAANGSKEFANKLFESQKRVDNLNRALENLTKRTEEVSRLRQRIGALDASANSKNAIRESLLTSSVPELLEANRKSGTVAAVSRFGLDESVKFGKRVGFGEIGAINFGAAFNKEALGELRGPLGNAFVRSKFDQERAKKAADIIKGRGNERIDDTLKKLIEIGVSDTNVNLIRDQLINPNRKPGAIAKILQNEGNRAGNTGNQVADKLVAESKRFAGIDPKTERQQIIEILNQIQAITTDSTKAVEIMRKNLEADQKTLFAALEKNNNDFFKAAEEVIKKIGETAATSEKAKRQTEINALEPDAKAADEIIRSGLDPELLRKRASQIEAAKKADEEYKASQENVESRMSEAQKIMGANYSKFVKGEITPGELANQIGEKTGLGQNEQVILEKKLSSLLAAAQEQKGKLESEILDMERLEDTRRTVTGQRIIDPEAQEKIAKKKAELNSLSNGSAVSLISEEVGKFTTENARRQATEANARVGNPIFANKAKGLSQNAIRFLQTGQNPDVVANKYRNMGGELNPNLVAPVRNLGVPESDPRFMGPPRPQAGQGALPPIPQSPVPGVPLKNVGLDNSNIEKVFIDFNKIFNENVKALSSIPRTIDMNVNQKVEVIINGAQVLNNLEPTIRNIANGAVKAGLNEIGGQLKAYNIKINYNGDDVANESKVNNNPLAKGQT